MERKKIMGIIPARYHSSRFPAKPLAKILGRPMFVHVYERAIKSKKIDEVILATDHEEIYMCAEKYNVPVVMTDPSHRSGTDRVYEAALKLGVHPQDIVINIQGDEPLLDPFMIDELIECFDVEGVEVATLAREISVEEAIDINVVKVVLDVKNFALYFSRSPIPYFFDGRGNFLGHVGMYGFRFEALKRFVSLEATYLERAERLEQLRLIQNNIPIYVKKTQCFSYGVDTPEDLIKVEKILKKETCQCGHCWH